MNVLSFLNPALLWGLGLASIPIIIHLLFRRQFRRVEWAPMRYLKLTIQRNRRRVQLEQLLLLLLRMALVLLLFFLVARPIVQLSGLRSWFGAGTRTSRVLILDDSLSMGLTVGDRTVFDRAVELATRVIGDLQPQDRFTLVLASQPKAPLLREVEVLDAQQIVELLRKQKPGGSFVSWLSTMEAVDELLASSTYPTREVLLLTDLRRAGWEQNLQELANRWASEKVRMRIFDLGDDAKRQVTLEDLRGQDPCALLGVPTRWEALVRNSSNRNLDQLEATVFIDGKPNPLILPPLPAGQQVRVPLTATFQEPGSHYLSLRLPSDDLQADNQHWAVIDVRERLQVLLVDGQPSNEPLGGETDFLALALSLGGENSAAFEVEMLTDTDLASLPAGRPDLIVLANVASLTAPQAQRLRALVEGGTGLVIFVGEQIDPDNYNRVLLHEGIDLLPAQLESISDQPVEGLVLEKNSPSALDAMRQLNPAVLERIKTNKYYQVRSLDTGKQGDQSAVGVRVLARWNDAQSSPAVIERIVGRGRVLLWTTTANKAWGDWPTQPSYVLAMRESGKAIVRSEGSHDLTAGEPIRRALAADVQVHNPVIETPDATAPEPLTIDSRSVAPESKGHAPTPALTYADTRRPGLYRMSWQADPGGQATDLFAVNPDIRESALTPITAAELRSAWGALEPEIITADTSDANWAAGGEEIWRLLATGLLGLLAVESCFAVWTGRQR